MKNKQPVNIFWFRRDLRLDDNIGFFHALKAGLPVLPVFIFDKDILDNLQDRADKRVGFIYASLQIMQAKLQSHGASLWIGHAQVQDAFAKLLKEYEVHAVFTNHDYEPYAIQRDMSVKDFLEKSGVAFNTFKDQVIFERHEVMKADGSPYTIYTPYSRIWRQKFAGLKLNSCGSEKLLSNCLQVSPLPFPAMSDIGFSEANGMDALPVIDKEIIAHYDSTRNFPAVKGTTGLSVHLRFGTVSVRRLAHIARESNDVWLSELIWREFFMMILFHFPKVVHQCFKAKYEAVKWRNDEKEFEAWCKGETGYPIVDAGMRELNATGFMHNRVRMIVASFLTKHLLIDWRWGEAYFAEKLLDYDLSANNGNWQWAAGCGCDAAPYFRIFNPSEQTKKFDPEHKYIEKWLGPLKEYTLMPIVQHEFARNRCLAVYKAAVGNE
jgi:deoxyribodipyrimidine photo-lyase